MGLDGSFPPSLLQVIPLLLIPLVKGIESFENEC